LLEPYGNIAAKWSYELINTFTQLGEMCKSDPNPIVRVPVNQGEYDWRVIFNDIIKEFCSAKTGTVTIFRR
jgi:hypothetical protein